MARSLRYLASTDGRCGRIEVEEKVQGRGGLQDFVANVVLSRGGREEASAALASSRTDCPPPIFPVRTVVRGDIPDELLSMLATTSFTRAEAAIHV
jgi:hypothetical protein